PTGEADQVEKAGGFVTDQWFGPPRDAQDETERDEYRQHGVAQAYVIAQRADDQRHHGAAQDAGAQDSRHGTVMATQGIEPKREEDGVDDRQEEAGQREGQQRGMRAAEQSQADTQQRQQREARQNPLHVE